MQTVFVHSNGYDSVLLVDDVDTVVSAWSPATKQDVINYLDDLNVDDWAVGSFGDPALEGLGIEAYGSEMGRDGELPEHRREFWNVA